MAGINAFYRKHEKWDSLLPLPKPYVVPADVFARYITGQLLHHVRTCESGHWDKVADMVANFAHEIDNYGHIPNGNRSYYLSRSQPPFFALMVELLAQHEGDAALKQYLPQMQKEYAYWMDGVENLQAGQQEKRVVKLQDGTLLNRYWTIAIRHDQSHGWKILPLPKAIRIDLPLKFTATCALPLRLAGISARAGWTIRSS
ncbi:periplasmic trehalase [Escherichia coli]|uniref:Periplasmic trehalase n=1 Tax=Escherichia coli TaxID=562 RepID=A0A484WNI3_ECOLX|nr:periplasmic trehalase [Escherichia coli]